MRLLRIVTCTGMGILVTASATARAQEPDPVRIALVAGEGDRAPASGAVELLEAYLTQSGDIQVVDRRAIDRILREQSLSSSGLTDRDTAIQLGQILHADVLLVAERVRVGASGEYRFVFTETRTGLVVGSRFLSADHVEKQPEKAVKEIADALAWLRVPDDKRHYVGFLGYHTDQRHAALAGLPDALTAVLAHEIGQAENVLVVDREHLERLREEEALTGIEPQLALSAYLVEGEIRAVPEDPKKVNIHTVAHPLAGKAELPALRHACDIVQFDACMKAVARDILCQIDVTPAQSPRPAAADEAGWFLRHAQSMQRYGEVGRSLPTLEAAYVLNPTPATADLLSRTLKTRTVAMVSAQGGAEMAESDKRDVLHRLIRAMELSLKFLRYRAERAKGQTVRFLDYRSPQVHVLGALWQRLASEDPENRELYHYMRTLKEQARVAELAYVRELWPKGRYGPNQIPGSTGYYIRYVREEIGDIWQMSRSATELVTEMKRLMAPWPAMPGYTSPYVAWELLSQPVHKIRHSLPARDRLPAFCRNPEGQAQLLEWCAWMREQNSFHFRMAGWYYEVLIAKEFDRERCRAAVREFVALYPEFLYRYGNGYDLTGLLLNSIANLLDETMSRDAYRQILDALVARLDRRGFVNWYNQNLRHDHPWKRLLQLQGDDYYGWWLAAALDRLPPRHLARYRNELYQASVDSVYEMIETQRLELLGDARPAPAEVSAYWNRYRVVPMDVVGALGTTHALKFLAPAADGVARVWVRPADKADGEVRAQFADSDGRVLVEYPGLALPADADVSWQGEITGAAILGRTLYVAAKGLGLLIFEPDTARRLTIEDGLPHLGLSSLALSGSQLFIGFDPDYLYTLDTATGELRELAYSRSLLKRNPLDGRKERFVVKSLLAGPEQGPVWMITENPRGLWRIPPAGDDIEAISGNYGVLAWEGDQLLISQNSGLRTRDLRNGEVRRFPLQGNSVYYQLPHLVMERDVISAGLGPHTGGAAVRSGGSFNFRGKGGLYLHKACAGDAFHLPIAVSGKPVRIDFMFKTAPDQAILANGNGNFWRLTDLRKEFAEEKAFEEKIAKWQEFVARQTHVVPVVTVSASSTAPASAWDRFDAALVSDGNPGTCWAADVNDVRGAWIRLELERATRISSLRVVNGWVLNEKRLTMYPINHRARRIEIATDAGEAVEVVIEDHNDPQFVALELANPCREITLTVLDIYEAEVIDINDPPWVNISEITVYEDRGSE